MAPAQDEYTRLFAPDEAGCEVLRAETLDEEISLDSYKHPRPRRVEIGPRVRVFHPPRLENAQLLSFTLHPDNPHLKTDGTCLFTPDGATLLACLVRVKDYRVPLGVRRIAPHAFESCAALERIDLPDSLEEIGEDAFFMCCALERADLPEGLRTIGKGAFFCTSLGRLRIPASLERVDDAAFSGVGRMAAIPGVGRMAVMPSSASPENAIVDVASENAVVDVASENARFFENGGCLCERLDDGVRVLAYLGDGATIAVPSGITELDSYALMGVWNARALELPASLRAAGLGVLMMCGQLEELRVHVADGRVVELYPANAIEGVRAYDDALNACAFDVERLAADCDATMPLTEPAALRGRRIIARLENGVLLDGRHRLEMMGMLEADFEEIVGACARADDTGCLQSLFDLGVLTGDNIACAIDVASEQGGVRAASFLLDASRQVRSDKLAGLEL